MSLIEAPSPSPSSSSGSDDFAAFLASELELASGADSAFPGDPSSVFPATDDEGEDEDPEELEVEAIEQNGDKQICPDLSLLGFRASSAGGDDDVEDDSGSIAASIGLYFLRPSLSRLFICRFLSYKMRLRYNISKGKGYSFTAKSDLEIRELARAQHTNHRTKLHLRIFLNNSKGTGMVTEYLSKMEKEVGKKELFSLPVEEFLISSFTCYLKRKLPTQGQVFLSPRTIGFYSSMFGRKTKFYFLWEDIEDIQGIPQSISSWSPSIIITLHKGRGMDAKHGAKSMDNGKLKFCLQSFASFSVANRTIMALWKAISLSIELKVQLAEEQSQINTLQSEDSGVFVGGSLEMKVMEKVGCQKYSATQWESDKPNEYQRHIHYKFSKKLSPVGGEVTGTQQKSLMPNKKGWVIEEVMELQGVLLGDFFTLHIKYQVEDLAPKQRASNVQVSLGIEWSKSTRHQKRIEKNALSSSSARLKEMFNLASRELSHAR
ncbi:C2 and GRAM domain-containing protein [Zea mays]|uniref:C2 and GRAM domain-containing protein n=1 Tax=Zea mays TaxID=4577 RepID=A0A1D6QJD3_MAIZE|nr:C2 and GRAM domain-containing protein [Zea mays]